MTRDPGFARKLLAYLTSAGWHWRRFFQSKPNAGRPDNMGMTGFPHVVAVKGPRLLFLLVKSDSAVLKSEEAGWLDRLRGANAEAIVARPGNWISVRSALTDNATPARAASR